MVERKSPHSFKVYFDIIEGEPLRDMNSNVNYANPKLILAVFGISSNLLGQLRHN